MADGTGGGRYKLGRNGRRAGIAAGVWRKYAIIWSLSRRTLQNGEQEGEIVVRFDTPQRAVTPGQSLVLYDLSGDSVLGGATIQRRL